MNHEFEDIHIDSLDDNVTFVCDGEIEYTIEWGEPDERWGYHGATPGTPDEVEVESWTITSITDYDGNDQSLRFNEYKEWMKQLQDAILEKLSEDLIEMAVESAREDAAEAAYENEKERDYYYD